MEEKLRQKRSRLRFKSERKKTLQNPTNTILNRYGVCAPIKPLCNFITVFFRNDASLSGGLSVRNELAVPIDGLYVVEFKRTI